MTILVILATVTPPLDSLDLVLVRLWGYPTYRSSSSSSSSSSGGGGGGGGGGGDGGGGLVVVVVVVVSLLSVDKTPRRC